MTPTRALAWTLAYVLVGSALFWDGVSGFVEGAYRYWFVDLLFLCLLVLLSWLVYRSYRKGRKSWLANSPKRERRRLAFMSAALFICVAVLQIVVGCLKYPDDKLSYIVTASGWLLVSAESWRRYLELRGPEVSSSE